MKSACWQPVCMERQRGVALLVVLWGLVLLSSVAVSYAYAVRTESRITRNELESTRAASLAEAGVARALAALMSDGLSNNERVAWLGEFELGGGAVQWRVYNAAGRVALNQASPALLDRLLEGLGVEAPARAALVDALLDWRDADQLHRLNGAEDPDYRQAGLDYGAADRPFVSVDELPQVMGMSTEVYDRLAPLVIVQGEHQGVNPYHAPAALLRALGAGSQEQIDAFLLARQQSNGVVEGPYTEWLSGSPFLSGETSPYRVVHAAGRTPAGARVDLEVVVSEVAQRLEIFDWRQVAALESSHGEH